MTIADNSGGVGGAAWCWGVCEGESETLKLGTCRVSINAACLRELCLCVSLAEQGHLYCLLSHLANKE